MAVNDITFKEHTERVEKQMGMTLKEFHEKLEALITPEYIKEAEENRVFLDKWITEGRPIVTTNKKDRKELDLQEGEYFVPCFVPDKPVRNELPIFWFYSNKDNLVSVISHSGISPKKVYWLPPKDGGDGRGSQKWNHPITHRLKTIKAYSLGALIFNEENIFGRARNMLELFGSYAYGVKGDPFNVQAHHEDSLTKNPELLYDHDTIETLVVQSHDLFQTIKDTQRQIRLTDSAQEKEQMETDLMKKISSVASSEAPGQIVVVATGENYYPDGSYKDSDGSNAYSIISDPLEIFPEEIWEQLQRLSI